MIVLIVFNILTVAIILMQNLDMILLLQLATLIVRSDYYDRYIEHLPNILVNNFESYFVPVLLFYYEPYVSFLKNIRVSRFVMV